MYLSLKASPAISGSSKPPKPSSKTDCEKSEPANLPHSGSLDEAGIFHPVSSTKRPPPQKHIFGSKKPVPSDGIDTQSHQSVTSAHVSRRWRTVRARRPRQRWRDARRHGDPWVAPGKTGGEHGTRFGGGDQTPKNRKYFWRDCLFFVFEVKIR